MKVNPKPDRRKIAARRPAHHRTTVEQQMKVTEQEERRLIEQIAGWGIGRHLVATVSGTPAQVRAGWDALAKEPS